MSKYAGAVSSARARLDRARKEARDLKWNRKLLRDKSIAPHGILFRAMRLEVRHLKVTANPSSAISDSIVALEKRASKGRIDPNQMASAIKKAESGIEDFTKAINDQITTMASVQKHIVVLSFRLNHLNDVDMAVLDDLVSKGFPESEARQIIALNQKKFIGYQRVLERQLYRFSRAVYREFKHQARSAGKASRAAA